MNYAREAVINAALEVVDADADADRLFEDALKNKSYSAGPVLAILSVAAELRAARKTERWKRLKRIYDEGGSNGS